MASFTRQAIMSSFMKLADEKPVSKISVKDIVEDCGVNRNTFYYHFEDIPTLVEAILKQEADALFKKCDNIASIEECMQIATRYASGKKKALLHLYNSVSRDVYEKYLMEICEYTVQKWFDRYPKEKLSDETRSMLIRAYKCELFGSIIDWLNNSMNEGLLEGFLKLTELRAGELERMIDHAGKD